MLAETASVDVVENHQTPVVFQTEDAFHLKGNIYGEASNARMAVVIHAATSVPAGYYSHFARWLAETHNAVVLIYDYRDFGASKARPVKQATSRMSDWGILDQEAALAFMLRRFGHLPLRVIGHSLGAHWLAFHRSIDRVDRVVAVAAGPNYWRDNALSFWPRLIWFWGIGGPAATTVLGYLPAWVGLGSDLPAGVYWQWRKWCRSPEFSIPEWGTTLPMPDTAKASFHLTLMPIADDIMIPPKMARRLAAFYPEATIHEDLITPAEQGLKSVGHLRIFSPRCKAFWPRIAAPLVD
ncbi:MAG: alpha/beta hydrolase family protein [Beijerinckiaceae bacterium]